MTLQGGDREFGHGDQITVEYDDTTDAAGGEAVDVTGRSSDGDRPTVELTDDSDNADGIVADSATQGDNVQIVMHGIVWARVLDGDDASASSTVGESATAGVLTTAESDYRVLEGEATDAESGEKIAKIRFES
jgi:hypothetical protein